MRVTWLAGAAVGAVAEGDRASSSECGVVCMSGMDDSSVRAVALVETEGR